MKNKITHNLLNTIILTLCLAMAIGCKESEYNIIEQALYFSGTGASTGKKIPVDDQGGLAIASVRAVKAVPEDTELTFEVDPAALAEYNKKNGSNYLILTEKQYKLSTKKAVIKAGDVLAPTITIEIEPMTKEMITSGEKYAIPVTIKSSIGTVLESGKSQVFLLDRVIVTSVPVMKSSRPAVVNMQGKEFNLLEWSVEFRVNMSKLGTKVGEMNNQAIFNNGGAFIRFGDTMIPGNILQVKTTGTQVNANTVFSPNKWYHLAFVSDGVLLKVYVDGELDVTLSMPGTPTPFKNDIRICGAGTYLKAEVMMSEIRFWTKALTQGQIRNNMFEINPQSEGLEGYWKLNEGEGITYNDATNHGYTGKVEGGSITWVHGVRSDGK